MHKETLANIISEYHCKKGRYNFLYLGEERANKIARLIGRGKYILDLGCRDGMLTRYFIKENKVIGLDIDKKALSICRDNLNIKTIWHDVNYKLPFNDCVFDIVVAAELLEHVYYPQFLVREIRRVLKCDGYFIGSVNNAFYIKNRLKFIHGNLDIDLFHLHLFSLSSLNCLLNPYFSKCSIFPLAGGRNPFRKLILRKLVNFFPSLWAIDFVFNCAEIKAK